MVNKDFLLQFINESTFSHLDFRRELQSLYLNKNKRISDDVLGSKMLLTENFLNLASMLAIEDTKRAAPWNDLPKDSPFNDFDTVCFMLEECTLAFRFISHVGKYMEDKITSENISTYWEYAPTDTIFELLKNKNHRVSKNYGTAFILAEDSVCYLVSNETLSVLLKYNALHSTTQRHIHPIKDVDQYEPGFAIDEAFNEYLRDCLKNKISQLS